MKIVPFIKGSLTQFRINLVRTGLTLLGIIFGVASVIAMVTIGEGAQKKILDNINAMGATLVHILPNKLPEAQVSQIINDSRGLSQTDVQAMKSMIPMENRSIGFYDKVRMKTTDLDIQVSDFNVFAVSQGFLRVNYMKLLAGRDFQSLDYSMNASVCLISLDYADRFFSGPEKAVGKFVSVNYKWFRILGVYCKPLALDRDKGKKGLPIDVSEFNESILIPITTSLEKISPPKTYSELDKIVIRCRDLMETNQIAAMARSSLNISHNDKADYKIVSPLELLEQKQATQRIFNVVLLSIASISLLVGGIGIMNIMLANVLERRSEIGIRRALGAKKKHIIFQFLFESVFICLIGGFAGIFGGLAISFCILRFTEIPVAFTIQPVILSFGISVFVGILFGIMPAWEAANLNPIEALRHE